MDGFKWHTFIMIIIRIIILHMHICQPSMSDLIIDSMRLIHFSLAVWFHPLGKNEGRTYYKIPPIDQCYVCLIGPCCCQVAHD